MMRLIDAGELFNWGKYKLSDAVKYGNKNRHQQEWSYSTVMMCEVADEIDGAPTIDSAPVVHGEWVEDEIMHPDESKCSACGELWNYCDNYVRSTYWQTEIRFTDSYQY